MGTDDSGSAPDSSAPEGPTLPGPPRGADVIHEGLDPILWGVPDEDQAVRSEIESRLTHYGAATVRLNPHAPMALTFHAFVDAMDALSGKLAADTEHEDSDAPFTRVFRLGSPAAPPPPGADPEGRP